MAVRRILLLLLLLVGPVALADPGFLLGGIQINEPDQAAWADTLGGNGFNTMQVTVYARQPRWDSADLVVKPLDEGTVQKIRAARAAGLEVVLILRLDVDHAYPENRFLWHGLVLPSTPEKIDAWFERYAEFVLQWADVAEREGVTMLGLGSEMNAITATRTVDKLPGLERYYLNEKQQTRRRELLLSQAHLIPPELIRAPGDASPVENLRAFMEARDRALYDWAEAVTFGGRGFTLEQRIGRINARRALMLTHWQHLITAVRQRYSGQLTYAANFDNYMDIAFWDRLDVMGINAYFPLREPGEDASIEAFTAAWGVVFDDIEATQAELNVPGAVVFTELGYTRRAGGTTAPWAWEGFELVGKDKTLMVWETLPFDPAERVRAMAALAQVNQNRGGPLAGLLYWKLTSKPYHAEGEPFSLLLQESAGHPDADPLQAALLKFLDTPADREPAP